MIYALWNPRTKVTELRDSDKLINEVIAELDEDNLIRLINSLDAVFQLHYNKITQLKRGETDVQEKMQEM